MSSGIATNHENSHQTRFVPGSPLRRMIATAFRPATALPAFEERLNSIRHAANLLALYKHFFPEEYAASEASLHFPTTLSPKLAELLTDSYYGPDLAEYEGKIDYFQYSQKEQEFLALVYVKLFNFDLDTLVVNSIEGYRRDDIPLDLYSISLNDNNFNDYSFGAQLMLLLSEYSDYVLGGDDVDGYSMLSPQGIEARPAEEIEEELDKYKECLSYLSKETSNYWLFARFCQEQSERLGIPELADAPLALDVVNRDTGINFYDCDYTSDMSECLWDEQVIRVLTHDWAAFLAAKGKVSSFFHWLEKSYKNFALLVQTWNASCVELSRVQVQLASSPGAATATSNTQQNEASDLVSGLQRAIQTDIIEYNEEINRLLDGLGVEHSLPSRNAESETVFDDIEGRDYELYMLAEDEKAEPANHNLKGVN